MEKRNINKELLNSFAKIKRKAILQAAAGCVVMIIVLLIMLSFMWRAGVPKEVIFFMGIIYMMVFAFCFFCLKDIYIKEKKQKLSKDVVGENLSIQKFTEVTVIDIEEFRKEMISLAESYTRILPVDKPEEYIKSILDLIENPKFYASVSTAKSNSVDIFVKYNTEDKMRYYKSIDKAKFLDNYFI